MIVIRLHGQFHLSGMVYLHPAAVIPADVMDGFAGISPILANIYLDNFDKYMEEYALRFNKGKERQGKIGIH